MIYLGKDIYKLLLVKYLDPASSVKCFQTKFFYELLSTEERYGICVKAAATYMSKIQTELWLTYNKQMKESSKETHINCWICCEPVRKKYMKKHLRARYDHSGFLIGEKCSFCNCAYPGSNGPHPSVPISKSYYTPCPLSKIQLNEAQYRNTLCPNIYNPANEYSYYQIKNFVDFSEKNPCFLIGCELQVTHHIKNCEWTCKFCKKEFKGPYTNHFDIFEREGFPKCTVYREPCHYINCPELILRNDYYSHTHNESLPSHTTYETVGTSNYIIKYKHQMESYKRDKDFIDKKKRKEDLIEKLKQLVIDLQ